MRKIAIPEIRRAVLLFTFPKKLMNGNTKFQSYVAITASGWDGCPQSKTGVSPGLAEMANGLGVAALRVEKVVAGLT